jgi:serine/threonine-protein kinase RsbW
METAVFPGFYTSLAGISDLIHRAAQQTGLDDQATYAVQMAVDEACANIIEHAYGGEGIGEITCTVIPDRDRLTVVLADHGRPFDPKQIRDPNRKLPLAKRKEGGLGLFFIRRYMDEVRFEFSEQNGNQLTMIKRKGASD